ncbi:Uncharacterised protein [Bordetella pertussis]|nr:Uncharacterised protein [Bordetella pertussis]
MRSSAWKRRWPPGQRTRMSLRACRCISMRLRGSL